MISLEVPGPIGTLGPQEDRCVSSLAPMSLFPRSQLAVIPQEPFLFSGTVRENLDPQGLHDDRALWQALEQCHLSEVTIALGESQAQAGRASKKQSGCWQCRCSACRRPRRRAGREGPELVPGTEAAAVSGQGSSDRCQGETRGGDIQEAGMCGGRKWVGKRLQGKAEGGEL